MFTKSITLSNPIYEILQQATGEIDINNAATKLLKDFFQLKTHALREKISIYEKKYGMSLREFEQACLDGRIKDPFSYEVESDNWDWDSAMTELKDTEELKQWLE